VETAVIVTTPLAFQVDRRMAAIALSDSKRFEIFLAVPLEVVAVAMSTPKINEFPLTPNVTGSDPPVKLDVRTVKAAGVLEVTVYLL
jgi:hypothetical protein